MVSAWFLYCKVPLFLIIIDKNLGKSYFEAMQMSCCHTSHLYLYGIMFPVLVNGLQADIIIVYPDALIIPSLANESNFKLVSASSWLVSPSSLSTSKLSGTAKYSRFILHLPQALCEIYHSLQGAVVPFSGKWPSKPRSGYYICSFPLWSHWSQAFSGRQLGEICIYIHR